MAKKPTLAKIKYVLSDELEEIVGKDVATRPEVMKAVWAYIKENDLNNGRNIKPDKTLSKVTGKATITMFELAGKLSPHFGERVN